MREGPGLLGARGREEASPLGKELVSEAAVPSGPQTHVLREGDAPPHPAPRERGRGPRSNPGPGRATLLGAARPSVLLLLLLPRRGRGRFVLDPEAFREEVDDGAVEVPLEALAVEVMAFVRVDLQRRRAVSRAHPPRGGRPQAQARCSLTQRAPQGPVSLQVTVPPDSAPPSPEAQPATGTRSTAQEDLCAAASAWPGTCSMNPCAGPAQGRSWDADRALCNPSYSSLSLAFLGGHLTRPPGSHSPRGPGRGSSRLCPVEMHQIESSCKVARDLNREHPAQGLDPGNARMLAAVYCQV